MKLSISNLAFKGKPLEETLGLLGALAIRGIEVAPGLLFDDPLSACSGEREAIKGIFLKYRVPVIGLHALFYQQPDLSIFGREGGRGRCLQHFEAMIRLCADLGGTLISFGAAANRRRGDLPFPEAMQQAASFFKEVAQIAERFRVVVCLEPLAKAYKCDFINNASEAAELVRRVGHMHFQMLLDVGTMSLNGENISDILSQHADILYHVHINDPHLQPPGAEGIDHVPISQALRRSGYTGWLTLEFLAKNLALQNDLAYAITCYHP